MKKAALLLSLLLLVTYGAAHAEDCDCTPVEYQDLINMPLSEIVTKIDQYSRSKETYSHGGSTYCFYTCATELERLGDAKVQKESELVKGRAARRALEQDTVLRPQPLTR